MTRHGCKVNLREHGGFACEPLQASEIHGIILTPSSWASSLPEGRTLMTGSAARKVDQTTDGQGGAEDYFLEGSAPRAP